MSGFWNRYSFSFQIRPLKMFTTKNLKMLVFVTNLAWYTGAVPYRFIKQPDGEQAIVGTFTNFRALTAIANFTVSSLYLLLILFRLLQKLFLGHGEASIEFLVKMSYLFFAYGLPLILELNSMAYWKQVPRCLSQYIKFYRYIQGRWNWNDW